ncbi:WhiB family transcriptional regulator, redox-sensing transcriptional regulator [Quadrisphaera granulorum]|uniref:Transcriptional regulator WhiB n=2 Tax=Quadrisphaera granulorum TaxID=317664 RepID=A0A316A6G1_9ACTN|nr:WhiB family transcriptional regulator [Quadrisphaera granulorum]PWJ53072.1 WhiB family redox-sensing transcriptional regulator [Quadrisphaera granulorum]SZE97237.1 WhiB family transcriptional regulator, redox-sensing transcriptional regulator [Quadrisphaera granulorum]
MSESTTVSLGLPRPRTALPTETGSLPVVTASVDLVTPRRSLEALTGPSADELDTLVDDLTDDLTDDDVEDGDDDELGDADPALHLMLGEGDADDAVDWQERALCAQTDPESFFPEKGGSTREAKRVCMSCEVRVPCLEYALANDERFGIWGGLSERERRRVKRRAV